MSLRGRIEARIPALRSRLLKITTEVHISALRLTRGHAEAMQPLSGAMVNSTTARVTG
jgi:hypothetical protein